MATDRRRFFAGGVAAGAAILSGCGKKGPPTSRRGETTAPGPLHAFVVENGQPGQAGFSVGLLATRDPAAQVLALANIRRQTKFRTELEFASTNRFKLGFLEPAFAHLAASADLKAAVVVASKFPGWAARSDADRQAAYLAVYRTLLDSLPASDRAGLFVHLSPHSSGGRRDAKLVAGLQTGLGPRATISLDGERFRDLPQLASVLFGSVRYAAGPMRSKTKRRTVQLLKTALKLSSLDPARLAAGGKIAAIAQAF